MDDAVRRFKQIKLRAVFLLPLLFQMFSTEPISVQNIEALVLLSTKLWPDSSAQEMQNHYQEVLANDASTALLLRTDTRYLGFVELSTRRDYVEGADELPVAYIEGLYIEDGYRNQSLGKQLITAAEKWAIEKGFTHIYSDAELEKDNSICFHAAVGFEEVSRIVCFRKNIAE